MVKLKNSIIFVQEFINVFELDKNDLKGHWDELDEFPLSDDGVINYDDLGADDDDEIVDILKFIGLSNYFVNVTEDDGFILMRV